MGFSGFGGNGRFGPSLSGGPRFTQPTQANTTAIFSQPPMSVPSAGLPKGLNPQCSRFQQEWFVRQYQGQHDQGTAEHGGTTAETGIQFWWIQQLWREQLQWVQQPRRRWWWWRKFPEHPYQPGY